MDPTIRKVVDVYVRDGNRKTLKKLVNRRRLLVGLSTLALDYDTRKQIVQCEDIAVIERALAKLNRAAA
jgi:hypothetical protein